MQKNSGDGMLRNLGMPLLEEGVDNVLLLLHVFLAFFQPVAFAFDVDDGAVVQDAVEDRGGDGDVGKDLVPLRKSFVAGKDCGDLLIPPGNELKEQICALNIHGQITNFVNDKQFVFAQSFELVRQPVFKMSLFKLLNQGVTVDVVGGKPMSGGKHAKRRSQMGLTIMKSLR